jgi:predicted transcriptional regulator
MKSSNVKYLNLGFNQDQIKFIEENKTEKRKPVKEYKSFIIESVNNNISCEKIALVLEFSPAAISRFVRRIRFLGEIKD